MAGKKKRARMARAQMPKKCGRCSRDMRRYVGMLLLSKKRKERRTDATVRSESMERYHPSCPSCVRRSNRSKTQDQVSPFNSLLLLIVFYRYEVDAAVLIGTKKERKKAASCVCARRKIDQERSKKYPDVTQTRISSNSLLSTS